MTKAKPLPKMKPCPFCGGKTTIHCWTGMWYTHCPNIECPINADYRTQREAINARNRRVGETTETSGFTLIEMLVALTLAIIIAGVMVTAFGSAIRIKKQSTAKIEAMRSADAVLGILVEDMRTIPTQPVLFVSDGDRLGLMFLSMTTFGVPDGVPGTATKVGYYVTEANELMRVAIPAADDTYSADDIHKLVYGMTRFDFRYYYDRGISEQGFPVEDRLPEWFDAWDSTRPGGADGVVGVDRYDPAYADDLQFQCHPDVVEVRMRVVDYDKYLEGRGQNAVVMTRLIRVGP